jgi:hypothetical protein
MLNAVNPNVPVTRDVGMIDFGQESNQWWFQGIAIPNKLSPNVKYGNWKCIVYLFSSEGLLVWNFEIEVKDATLIRTLWRTRDSSQPVVI